MGMTREEKSKFHYDLINFLTGNESDAEFFEKLVYANQIISNCLINFTDDMYDYKEMVEEKWEKEYYEEY